MKEVLITGVSGGFGEALTRLCLERGDNVYAMGRHNNKQFMHHPGYYFFPVDLTDVTMLRENIKTFVKKHRFNLVILNAGMLGEIKEFGETSVDEIRRMLDLNVWANKQIIDTLDLHATVDQLIAISSEAAVSCQKGWGAYALSIAALNTMIKIYAREKPWTHFSAIAPGVIMTPTLKRLFEITDPVIYPSIQELRDGTIMTPDAAARIFLNFTDKALEHESGSFLDLRKPGTTFPVL